MDKDLESVQEARRLLQIAHDAWLKFEEFTEDQVEEMEELSAYVLAGHEKWDAELIEFKAGSAMWFSWKCLLANGWAMMINTAKLRSVIKK